MFQFLKKKKYPTADEILRFAEQVKRDLGIDLTTSIYDDHVCEHRTVRQAILVIQIDEQAICCETFRVWLEDLKSYEY